MKKILLICLLSILLLGLKANSTINDIRFGYYDFGTRIVIETDNTTDYTYDVISGDLILRINSSITKTASNIKPKSKFIKSFKISDEDDQTEITIATRLFRRPNIFTLSGSPYKIVVDLLCEPSKGKYANDLGIANYLRNLGLRKAADVEFAKIEKSNPDKKDFYYYYALNDLKLARKKDAIKHFKMVPTNDRNYADAVKQLKKLGVSIEQKKKEVEPAPVQIKETKPLETEEIVEVEEEVVESVHEDSDSTSVVDPSFFKSPFWYLTLVIAIIVIGSTIFFFVRRNSFKSKFDESSIKFDNEHDLKSKHEAIRKLYNQGWSVKAISKELNIDQDDVYLTIEEESEGKA